MLSKLEEKFLITKEKTREKLLPVCEALKLSGYELPFIAEICGQLSKGELPDYFSILNNKYLVIPPNHCYDLVNCCPVDDPSKLEPKRMALTFWL